MPRQPSAVLQERLRALPPVPPFMPPFVGSVAAEAPRPKAKLLSYQTVLERRHAAKSEVKRGGAIA
eukprot:4542103-Alexandrium_andersonii.AAC.1